jgi:hypothetical protein
MIDVFVDNFQNFLNNIQINVSCVNHTVFIIDKNGQKLGNFTNL